MSLPDPQEPLVLADGTKINPKNGTVIKDYSSRGGFTEIPSNTKAQALVAKTRRSIAELPMPGPQMNSVSLILFYKVWGLGDLDIATTLGMSLDQVKNIQQLEAYQKLSDDLLKNVLEHEANDIRTFFTQNANKAAQKIVNLVEEEGALGFKASQDILDRAGFRPADVVEHKHQMEGSLKIEHIRRDRVEDEDIPAIETSFRDITPNASRS